MPSAISGAASRHDDLDNYGIDPSDDPFASPSPPNSATKKRKEKDAGLGIDEEVSVQKRIRVPNVKLDEDRLLGPAGIPKLRKRAKDLKIKGKGHEFSDAARLLSFYQLWLDDLFPKARFLDALNMVEKAGHKKRVMVARNEWISEGKPKDRAENDDLDVDFDDLERVGAETDSGARQQNGEPMPASRQTTPTRDVPDDDDLYGATPRASKPSASRRMVDSDDDDLDALIAEAEKEPNPSVMRRPAANPDDDDIDALIAEAENQDSISKVTKTTEKQADDFADDEAALMEMSGW